MSYTVFNLVMCPCPLQFQGERVESKIRETLTERELHSFQQNKFGYTCIFKNTLFLKKQKYFAEEIFQRKWTVHVKKKKKKGLHVS